MAKKWNHKPMITQTEIVQPVAGPGKVHKPRYYCTDYVTILCNILSKRARKDLKCRKFLYPLLEALAVP